jgi:hypothetical protein
MVARTVVGGILGGIAGALVGSVLGFFSLLFFMDGLIIAHQRVDGGVQIIGVAIIGMVAGLVLGGLLARASAPRSKEDTRRGSSGGRPPAK